MKPELTPKQRDWIIEIVRKHWSDADSSYFLDLIKKDLNANTAEDEGLTFTDWQKLNINHPDSKGVSNTAEDDFVIRDYLYLPCQSCHDPACKDKACEKSFENQIALRKIDEIFVRLNWDYRLPVPCKTVQNLYYCLTEGLQQEDE